MYQKPSPLKQKVIDDAGAIRKIIHDIQKKIQDPQLFEKLPQSDKDKTK